MTDVAIAGSGDRPVVVGIARGGEPEGRSHLVAVFCEDVSCVEHTVRQVAMPWIPPLDHQGVDVAVATDGTAVVSLVSETYQDSTFSALRLVSFGPDGGQPVVRDLSHAIPPGSRSGSGMRRTTRGWRSAATGTRSCSRGRTVSRPNG